MLQLINKMPFQAETFLSPDQQGIDFYGISERRRTGSDYEHVA
jgi:hypothetical protein